MQDLSVQLTMPFVSVNHLLSDYAMRWPDKLAIVDLEQDKSLSYSKLESLVAITSSQLQSRGVKRADKVVLLSDESIEKLVLWLAIWRVGAVVCPLNIEMNERHLFELCKMCSPTLILLQESLSITQTLPIVAEQALIFRGWDPSGQAILPGDAGKGLDTLEDLPEFPYEANDLSCIFCTSGTTEKPKLVVYDHFAHWLGGLSMVEALGLTPEDRTLEYRSFGWASVQILSLMPFLQLGLTLHIAPRFSKSRFFDWIERNGITVSVGVPTVVSILLDQEIDRDIAKASSLRLMTCSTAPLSEQQWLSFEERYKLQLIQMYGMSEANWICANRTTSRRLGTVGRPVLYQQVDIVDVLGKRCDAGTEGEVSVSGPQIAVGYLSENGNIDMIRGAPLKTGDLGICDADGFVRISGRTKDLIIRGGVNIAPAEIDGVLVAYNGIQEAAAVGVPDRIYGEEVVCFIVGKTGVIIEIEKILEHCKKHLPLAKVPKEVIVIDKLPRNDRGKVLRNDLRHQWTLRINA